MACSDIKVRITITAPSEKSVVKSDEKIGGLKENGAMGPEKEKENGEKEKETLVVRNTGGRKLTLLSHQIKHFERLCSIIDKGLMYLDTSAMGLGKTYIAMALAIKYNFPVFVVCPKSLVNEWRELLQEHNIPIYDILTYETLRGKEFPRHEYLTLVDGEYQVTAKFQQLVQQGMLLVFDEIQKIKNTSKNTKACRALSLSITTISCLSRCVFLSATPFDKREHTINFLRTVGFIRTTKLCHTMPTGEVKLLGAQELINVCSRLDSKKTGEIIRRHPMNNKAMTDLCFMLHLEVIKKHICSAMDNSSLHGQFKNDIKNGYYNFQTKREEEEYRKAIQNLSSVVRYNEKTKVAEWNMRDSKSAMNGALEKLEISKHPLLFRLVREQLLRDPKCKVVVFVKFMSTIDYLMHTLNEFKTLELRGENSIRERNRAIQLFQENPEWRVLICSIPVGAYGINLHDKNGAYPRHAFIVPNYSIQELHQCTGRIHRTGVQSNSTTRFIYGKCGLLETSILNALSRKTEVMRNTLEKDGCQGMKFPGELEIETEADIVTM